MSMAVPFKVDKISNSQAQNSWTNNKCLHREMLIEKAAFGRCMRLNEILRQ